MAGHSQFKNIMHRKGAQDARRGKVFTKIIRELTVAAKTGLPDAESNPRLRSAISAAREANMPRDTIERAIKRGAGGEDEAQYEEVRYEGYGPGGVALIVEALTDNRNRTAGDVRSAFTKSGGALGESNSVAFGFVRLGRIRYKAAIGGEDTVMEAALEAGADDMNLVDDHYEIDCGFNELFAVRDGLAARFGEPESAAPAWKPLNTIAVDDSQAEKLLRLIENLEDFDDVQSVWGNYEISDSFLAAMAD